MASIGSITLHSAKGQPSVLQMAHIEFTRPGVDGHGYHEIGKRAQEFTVRSFHDYSTGTGAKTAFESYANMVGTTVTFTDDNSVAWTYCFVVDVQLERPIMRVLSPVGGANAGEYPVYAVWTLRQVR